jgi:hypothetical protein
MSCALTQGFNLDCRDSIGGLKEVYLIELGNLGTVTEASGIVTAIVKASGKRFWKYSLIRETSNFDQVITPNDQNGTLYYAQTLQLIVNKLQASVRNEIMLIAQNNIAAVAVDNNGKGWLLGREFGLVLGGNSGSGTAWADRNGSTLTFGGNEKQLAPEVNSATIATLETAA